MAVIGLDFPKTRDARKKLLKELIEGSKPINSVKVPGHGSLPVYKIPLDYLSYNPYNTRFIAQAKTLEKRLGRKLSNEEKDDINYIEKFIWEEKSEKNENTIKSLINDGQLEPGVVTNDGLILAGNRRFRLLNHISRNREKYPSNGVVDSLKYFEAAIINDTQMTEKDIVELESKFQYGSEEKVDYSPIQKYLAAHYQNSDLGFDTEIIAKNFMALTNGNKKKVEEWLEVYELMNDYLEYIGEPGIYTALESSEEAFINLRTTIKSLETGKLGKTIWAFSNIDITELKLRYFDYIRNEQGTHKFRLFKDIFSDENKWKEFNNNVKELIKSNKIDSFQNYRIKYSDKRESEISKIRKNDYNEKCGVKLNKIYGVINAYFTNKEIEETPINIAKDILLKLDKLNAQIENKDIDSIIHSDEFVEKIRTIMKKLGSIKQKID